MLDEASLVAVVAHGLLNRLTAVHGMMSLAQTQLGPGGTQSAAAELLQAADGAVTRMTSDLHCLARGRPPHDPSAARPDEDTLADVALQQTTAISPPVP